VSEAILDPSPRGPHWTQISPVAGSLFHEKRHHSLFRQGCLLYDLIPNMPEHRLRPLIAKYADLLSHNNELTETFGPV